MLQDRMAGMTDGVLTRTGPSATFTMAIAAAIGALAAPAAVAASVFTAASAAGSSTTTATTAHLFTAMSASKAFLVTTAIVAAVCVPIGYHLHTGPGPQAARNSVPEGAAETATAAKKAAPSFDDSTFFAEWRELHQRYGTNAQAMPVLYKAVAELKDPFRRQAFRAALIAEWAEVDPAAGLPFFLRKGPDEAQRRQFFEEWLGRDARGAVEALLAASGEGWETMARQSLKEIARVVPSHLPEIVSRLPKADNYWDTKVREAFTILAESNLASAREAAGTVTGPNRDEALAGVAQTWAKAD